MPIRFWKQKIKVSREEFARVLLLWLARCLSAEGLREEAEALSAPDVGDPSLLFGFDLNSRDDLAKLLQELFVFNMWAIVVMCKAGFKDVDKCDDCLNMFHRLVYENLLEEREEDFDTWMLSMSGQYGQYLEAMKAESGPVWGLTTLLSKKLFGKLALDALLQFQMSLYITSSMGAVENLIGQYDVK